MSSDFISFQFFEDTRGLEKVGRYFKLQPISIFAIFSQTLVNACHHSVHYSVVTFNKIAPFIFRLACVRVHLGTSKCYLK